MLLTGSNINKITRYNISTNTYSTARYYRLT